MEKRAKFDRDSVRGTIAGEKDELERAKEHMASLFSATHRTISSMPIIVSYTAKIALVKQIDREEETRFITTRWLGGKVGKEEHLREEHLDPYEIRNEFLQIASPRQALDFLRNTGEFLPLGDPISWEDFQRWQRVAEIVIEHKSLAALIKKTFAKQPKEASELDGELGQVWMMLTGIYPHTYFKKEESSLTSRELENLRRSAEVLSETPRQAERAYADSLRAIEEGRRIAQRRQRELERWFYAPPPSGYSIEFAPRNPTTDFVQNVQRGGALVDYIHPLEDLFPALVIRPSCTLEAIAGSIYADRIAGARSGKCPGCGKWFEIESQKAKKYCGDTCRERLKKQRLRDR